MNRLLTLCFFVTFGLMACETADFSDTSSSNGESFGMARLALTDARARVLQETSLAMTGGYTTYTSANWPTVTTTATYPYVKQDVGAWNLLIAANGTNVSCRKSYASGNNYTPCSLTYGMNDSVDKYVCQGSCPAAPLHGGQCKSFMNLVAYRSGQYQNPNYAFTTFPSDSTITNGNKIATYMPVATYDGIMPGDFLRMPYGHALIVVRKIDSQHVVVMDSNWINGNGNEIVGSHTMAFTGKGGISDLGSYRVLNCVYNGTC
jgi:hypothetical protein